MQSRKLCRHLLFLVVCLLMFNAIIFAQTNRQLEREKSNEAATEKRTALVIGNGDYLKARKLTNPVNDATDMTKTLTEVGFEVISGTNLSLKQMTEKVREFGDKLKANGGVGLFYYAGHGVQVNNKNYLIPVEADVSREDEIDFAALNFEIVLRKMATANNGLNIVILDACRNNPFARSWSRNTDDGGLAQISAPTGTFIAYATSPDKTASDGDGRNGLYTSQLLKIIRQPNLKIEEAFKQVTLAVDKESKGSQIPWTSSSLRGEFYFKKSEIMAEVTKNATTEPLITAKTKTEQEKEAWDLVKNSASASDFRYYLEEFPDGANAVKARIRLEELVWQTVRGSDKTKIQAYLNEFPNGANASAARIRIRQLEESANVTTNPTTTSNNSTNRTAGAISKATLPGGVEMSFAYIPEGSFEMGDTNKGAIHTVKISKGFQMQTTEVTQAQWKAVMGVFPSNCDSGELKGKFLGDDKPIICVSWDNAQEFVRQMNLKNDGYKYRLSTEAEWEYAARSGTTGDYAGDLDSMAWYYNNSGNEILSGEWNENKMESNNNRMHEVATKQANAWGLYDMHGNVSEWCQDWYGSYPSGTVTDPTGATNGTYRVNRGGAWSNTAEVLRSAVRSFAKPSQRHAYFGFRVVREFYIDKSGNGKGNTITTGGSTTNPTETKGAIKKNSIGMNFAYIPAGSFQMGSTDGEKNEKIHTVTISQGFYLGTTEVTQAQWVAVMWNNPSSFNNCDNCPVENVSWEDIQAFIKKLNDRGDGKYLLPTEAEWEYAARAASTTKYSFGDGEGSLGNYAWYDANSGSRTHDVATKQPNALGLYDMHGNVWEWVQDWYGDYPNGSVTDPTGVISGTDRVLRGGSWGNSAVILRSAGRSAYSPSVRDQFLGFRVVRY